MINIDRYNHINVDDGKIKYFIDNKNSCFIGYKKNVLHIPFFMSAMANVGDDLHDVIHQHHEEIKKCLFNIDDIINNLPELVLCTFPTYDYFANFDEDEMDAFHKKYKFYYDTEHVSFYSFDMGYTLNIRYGTFNNNSIYLTNCNNYYDHFDIINKIVCTDQPFNPELFVNAIMTYVDRHLYILLNIFKVNRIKSAKKIITCEHSS